MLWQSLHMASKVKLLVMRGVWLTHVIRGGCLGLQECQRRALSMCHPVKRMHATSVFCS